MAERETEHRRIVVETPSAKREVEHTEAVRYPERSGVSGAALAAVVIGVIALAAVIILFVMNRQQQMTNDSSDQFKCADGTLSSNPPSSLRLWCNPLRQPSLRR